MKKIVIVAGGTLGHLYPILPVITQIRNRYQLYFIGTKSGLERKVIESNPLFKNTFFLDMQGFKRKLSLYNLQTIKKYFTCRKEAKKILHEISPNLVIGMGGYISGVVIKIAKKMKYKTIIHEQNSVLGLANKFVIKKVDAVFLNFPLEKQIKSQNVIIVGNPRLQEIYNQNKLKQEMKKYLVVVGGSRGSKVINETLISLIPELKKLQYRVTLITGNRFYEEHKEKLLKLNDEFIEIIPFTNNLILYLKKASVVISRAGATTLAELVGLRKVAILIPSPNVTSNHQEKNANIFVRNNCAIKISEKDLTAEKLLLEIKNLEDDYLLRTKLINNMIKNFNFHARDDFIKEMEKII